MININNSNDDDYYRYKMPKAIVKLGGNGNGIFTTINNIDEIGFAINTPSEILCKYISYTIGSPYNEKKQTFMGHHNTIQDIIFDYINNFVICQHCSIPELSYSLDKISNKKVILLSRCSACGNLNNIKNLNKISDKTIDNINKYLTKNDWPICKGNMVT